MNIALVLAGGIGQRAGKKIPKQYVEVLGKPLIVYTLETLEQAKIFDEIYVVCADEWEELVDSCAKKYDIKAFRGTITAGENRFETICSGVRAIQKAGRSGTDIICVAESSRPLTAVKTYTDTIRELAHCDYAFSAKPIYDALYAVNPATNEVTAAVDRTGFRLGQPPMAARLADLLEAISCAEEKGGEMQLAEAMIGAGKTLHVIPGDSGNWKITTAEDFTLLERMLEGKSEQ